jgi:hypothetical protein
MRNDILRPRDRLNPRQEEKVTDWCYLGVVVLILLILFGRDAKAETATTQSKEPWSIQQCDKLMGIRATSVFNISIWNVGGWPLWRVICQGKKP